MEYQEQHFSSDRLPGNFPWIKGQLRPLGNCWGLWTQDAPWPIPPEWKGAAGWHEADAAWSARFAMPDQFRIGVVRPLPKEWKGKIKSWKLREVPENALTSLPPLDTAPVPVWAGVDMYGAVRVLIPMTGEEARTAWHPFNAA